MPTQPRTKPVSAAQLRSYAAKASEFAEAAASDLAAGRNIAATSLAIHAGINAADAGCGARLGQRAAGTDQDQRRRCGQLSDAISRHRSRSERGDEDPHLVLGLAGRAVEQLPQGLAGRQDAAQLDERGQAEPTVREVLGDQRMLTQQPRGGRAAKRRAAGEAEVVGEIGEEGREAAARCTSRRSTSPR